MNGTVLGNKIADDILVAGGGGVGLTAGEAASVRAIWVTIATDITNHIDTQAVISPGSFANGGGAVTGTGDIS